MKYVGAFICIAIIVWALLEFFEWLCERWHSNSVSPFAGEVPFEKATFAFYEGGPQERLHQLQILLDELEARLAALEARKPCAYRYDWISAIGAPLSRLVVNRMTDKERAGFTDLALHLRETPLYDKPGADARIEFEDEWRS